MQEQNAAMGQDAAEGRELFREPVRELREPVREPSYEQRIARLEEIVGRLERGDVPLADSLALFQEGTGLIRACSLELDRAEQEVVKLMKGPDGAPVELPFEEAETARGERTPEQQGG